MRGWYCIRWHTDRQAAAIEGLASAIIRYFLFLIYFFPSTRVHVVPFTGGLLLLLKATGAAREPTPRPFTTVGEPIPRTGRHWELNPVPLDLQTNALPTELTGRLYTSFIGHPICRSAQQTSIYIGTMYLVWNTCLKRLEKEIQ